jgi:uncharacterized protein (DUF1015 family)
VTFWGYVLHEDKTIQEAYPFNGSVTDGTFRTAATKTPQQAAEIGIEKSRKRGYTHPLTISYADANLRTNDLLSVLESELTTDKGMAAENAMEWLTRCAQRGRFKM